MGKRRVGIYGFGSDYKAAMAAWPEDDELVYEACVSDVSYMQYASEAMKDNKKLVMRIVGNIHNRWRGGRILNYVSERLRDDEDVVIACIRLGENAFSYASDRIKNSYQPALQAAIYGITALQHVGESLRDNKKFVMDVYQNCRSKGLLKFEYVSERLRDDEDVVRLYCQTGANLQYASERLRGCREIALVACKDDGDAFQCVSDRFRDDKEFALEVCKSKRHANFLQYASERLRDDSEFALEVCKRTRHAGMLQYASERLRDDPEFVLEVGKGTENAGVLKYASERLRDDKVFVSEICKRTGATYVLEYASDRLRDDEELILECCQLNIRALGYASDRIKQKKEFVLPLCQLDSQVFLYVHAYYSDDMDFAKALLRHPKYMSEYEFQWLSERLRGDRSYVKRYCRVCGSAIQYASDNLKNDLELCWIAVKKGATLEILGEKAQDDYDIVYHCVKKDGYALQYASERLKNNLIIALTALNGHFPHKEYWCMESWDGYSSCDIFEFVGKSLKQNPKFAKIVIPVFWKTSYGQKYQYEELMAEPLQIFKILEKERDKLQLHENCEPKERLDFSEALKILMQEDET